MVPPVATLPGLPADLHESPPPPALVPRAGGDRPVEPLVAALTVRRVRAWRGPNLAAPFPVLHLSVDVSPDDKGAVTALGHHALAFQQLAGFDVDYYRVTAEVGRGRYAVVVAYEEEAPARAAVDLALQLHGAAQLGDSFDVGAAVRWLRALADRHRLRPGLAAVAAAARARDVPVLRLDTDGLPEQQELQLGHGVHQHRLTSSRVATSSSQEGAALVAARFPAGAPARVPIVAVTGTNGKTTTTRLIAHCFAAAGQTTGMTATGGIYVAGERILSGDCSGPKSARAVLLHPRVEAAVLETARGGILREGLGFDACDVAVVTNVSADHLGADGIETLSDLARVKRLVVEHVRPGGTAVLNADDPLVAEMAGVTRARVVYFSARGGAEQDVLLAAHLASGGTAAVVRDGALVLLGPEGAVPLASLAALAFTAGGRIPFQVQNALAAAAAAWSAGVRPADVAAGLASFRADAASLPGRCNVSERHGVQVVLDYAHNPAALAALGDAVSALGDRRTVLCLGLPGDRRDDDLRASLAATARYADEYVLCDHGDRRGRDLDEVPRLLQAAVAPGVPSLRAPSQAEGIALAWSRVRPGERLVVVPKDVDEALRQLEALPPAQTGHHGHEGRPGRPGPTTTTRHEREER